MYFSFSKFMEQISVITQEEKEHLKQKAAFDRILEATQLSDIENISIQTLASVMFNMHDYITEEAVVSRMVSEIFSASIKQERVKTARLL